MNRWKMVDLKSQHFACVYKLVFPNNKIYIGKSKDIGKRVCLYERKVVGKWSMGDASAVIGALKLYGMDKVGVEVLFEVTACNGVDWEKDLDYALGIVEMRWIKELDSSNPDVGYNGTEGGEMFGVKNMERVKEVEVEKKRVVFKDVIVERERERMTSGLPVVGYDINGNYIGEWASKTEFAKQVLGSSKVPSFGEWKKGYVMYEKSEPVAERVESYAEYVERTKAAEIAAKAVLEEKIGKVKLHRKTKLSNVIVLVDKSGAEFARYDNITEAAECTGIGYSSIYICLKNGYGTAGGFRVFDAEEWDADNTECLRRSAEKKVKGKADIYTDACGRVRSSKFGKIYQYDRHYNEIGEYLSLADASEKAGILTSSIYQASKKGGDSFAGGYHWRFESDRIAPKETPAEPGQPSQPKQEATNTGALFSDDDF